MAPAHASADPADPAGDGALRILVVDADDRTRESVVGILGIRHRFNVVGAAGDVGEAIALARAHRPDVVVLDPRLPEVTDGMALIRRVRAIDPGVAILAVGWSPDLEHKALAAGADGFVRKTLKPGDLAGAIRRCIDSRIGGAEDDLAAASAGIAGVKGGASLMIIDEGAEGAEARSDAAVSRSSDHPVRPVPTAGTGLIL